MSQRDAADEGGWEQSQLSRGQRVVVAGSVEEVDDILAVAVAVERSQRPLLDELPSHCPAVVVLQHNRRFVRCI